jgi:hypothetical protein
MDSAMDVRLVVRNGHLSNLKRSITMKRMILGKTISTVLATGGSMSAFAQSLGGCGPESGMMGGGWMGGYGGGWIMIVLVAVIASLVGWVVGQRKN